MSEQPGLWSIAVLVCATALVIHGHWGWALLVLVFL